MMKRILFAALVGFLACFSLAHARTWTDSTGKYRVEAEFVEFRDGKVRLRRADGKVVTVPFERLSEPDQQHVTSLGEKPGPPGEAPVAKSPEEAVALMLAAAQKGDADAFFALVAEPYGPIQRQIYDVSEKQQVELATLAKTLAARFGNEGRELGQSLLYNSHKQWMLLAGLKVVKSEPDGEARVKLTIESVRRNPEGGEQTRASTDEFIAVRQGAGWKLMSPQEARIPEETWQGMLGERTAELTHYDKVVADVATGKYDKLDQVTKALLGPPPKRSGP